VHRGLAVDMESNRDEADDDGCGGAGPGGMVAAATSVMAAPRLQGRVPKMQAASRHCSATEYGVNFGIPQGIGRIKMRGLAPLLIGVGLVGCVLGAVWQYTGWRSGPLVWVLAGASMMISGSLLAVAESLRLLGRPRA